MHCANCNIDAAFQFRFDAPSGPPVPAKPPTAFEIGDVGRQRQGERQRDPPPVGADQRRAERHYDQCPRQQSRRHRAPAMPRHRQDDELGRQRQQDQVGGAADLQRP